MERQMGGQVDGWTDDWVNRQMDGNFVQLFVTSPKFPHVYGKSVIQDISEIKLDLHWSDLQMKKRRQTGVCVNLYADVGKGVFMCVNVHADVGKGGGAVMFVTAAVITGVIV